MDGREPSRKRLLVAPRGVVARQSTDLAAIEDQHVAQAMRFIREHACEGILPRDVVAQIPLSRVALASRFKSIVGHTMGTEIQRVRIRLSRELLSETDLPIKKVAHRAGFRYVEYMTRLFTRMTGRIPQGVSLSKRGKCGLAVMTTHCQTSLESMSALLPHVRMWFNAKQADGLPGIFALASEITRLDQFPVGSPVGRHHQGPASARVVCSIEPVGRPAIVR